MQSFACNFLRDILKSNHTFDDSQKLQMLIEKLKSELNLIRIASQTDEPPNWLDSIKSDPVEAEGATHLLFGRAFHKRLFTASCKDDDDYYSKH